MAQNHKSLSTKRRRTEEDDGPGIVRSNIWFEDGNVIIQAESTQFRVHISVLSMHSKVLKDCFGIPQPKEQETVEGCLVVYMPDNATDIECVLSILYGDVHHVFGSKNRIPYPKIAAMMRLGRKYEFNTLYKEALCRLQADFTSGALAWKGGIQINSYFIETSEFLIDAVNLAVEFNIQSVLPAAMLTLCRVCTLEDILLGVERSDKSKAQLLPEALHMCLMGRATFPSSFFTQLTTSLGTFPSSKCTSRKQCAALLSAVWVCIIKLSADQYAICLPSWDGLVTRASLVTSVSADEGDDSDSSDDGNYDKRFCDFCEGYGSGRFERAQAQFWKQLPKCFDLPKWGSLSTGDIQ